MNRFYKKVKNYNKLSDYSDLIPHYYTKLIGVFILLGICIISVNLLDPLIFGEFMFIIIADGENKEFEKQKFIINISAIYKYYNLNAKLLKKELFNLFS